MVSVSIGPPDPQITQAFVALTRRAAGSNVFMHPVALAAAAATSFARIHVLSAWHDGELVGFWALRERRFAILPAFLSALPYHYAFLSNPVIDPDHYEVLPAFLQAIANEPRLPKVIQLKLLDADAPGFVALMAALGARRVLKLSERARPFLAGPSERKRSGATAKKLRQDWNRLCALGAVEIANVRDINSVCAAFEIFLDLEQRGWKGANGTAVRRRGRRVHAPADRGSWPPGRRLGCAAAPRRPRDCRAGAAL